MGKHWTSEEINKLKCGIEIQNRTKYSIARKRRRLGIKSLINWREEEIEILKKGEVPPGRTATAAYTKAIKLGLKLKVINILTKKRTLEKNMLKASIK